MGFRQDLVIYYFYQKNVSSSHRCHWNHLMPTWKWIAAPKENTFLTKWTHLCWASTPSGVTGSSWWQIRSLNKSWSWKRRINQVVSQQGKMKLNHPNLCEAFFNRQKRIVHLPLPHVDLQDMVVWLEHIKPWNSSWITTRHAGWFSCGWQHLVSAGAKLHEASCQNTVISPCHGCFNAVSQESACKWIRTSRRSIRRTGDARRPVK